MRRRLLAATAAVLLGGLAAAPSAQAAELGTWHAKQARLTAGAQSAGRSGSGVLVAVIDTWVDTRHPAFGGRALPGVDCTDGCSSAQVPDSCSHGTHVAGTVAARDYGVAPGAKVLPLQILKFSNAEGACTGNTTDAAAAIRYAVERGADVINLSVGGEVPLAGATTELPGAVSDAADAGAVVVFAAGNDSRAIADNYGGDALIVAATEPDGSLAEYSQHDLGVDVAAPGGEPFDDKNCRSDGSDCVASTAPNNEYYAMAGTSMAAPHVSGLAALLLGQRSSRGRVDVVNRIKATARPVDGGGSGLIDINAALGVRAATPSRTATAKPAPSRTTTAPRPPTASPTPTKVVSPSAKPSPSPSAASASPSASASSEAPSSASASAPPPDGSTIAAPAPVSDRAAPVTLATGLLVAVLTGHAVPLWRRRRAG